MTHTHRRTHRRKSWIAFPAGLALGAAAMGAVGLDTPSETLTGTTKDTAIVAAAAPAADPVPLAQPLFQAAKDLRDGTKLAAWRMNGDVKEFTLTVAPLAWETKPGVLKQAMAVNGTIPAPVIRVNEGDKLRLIVKNKMKEDTAIHWHGMDLPNEMDGVPGITQKPIAPGKSHTYEYTAISTGTHWYHSHMHGAQEGRGVYGAFEVIPAVGDIAADRDYRIVVGDGPLGFVFNGKSFPATKRLAGRVGERIRIRLIGAGPDLIHSIHLHLGNFQIVAQDGRRLPAPVEADTVLIGVGQTYDLIWVPTRTGVWMIHCHIFAHSETKRDGMTGMVSLFDIAPATAAVTVPQIPRTG